MNFYHQTRWVPSKLKHFQSAVSVLCYVHWSKMKLLLFFQISPTFQSVLHSLRVPPLHKVSKLCFTEITEEEEHESKEREREKTSCKRGRNQDVTDNVETTKTLLLLCSQSHVVVCLTRCPDLFTTKIVIFVICRVVLGFFRRSSGLEYT